MVYLDYSATTPVDDEVLDTFVKVSKTYIGNPNSLHRLGNDAKRLMDQACMQVASLFKVKPEEVIFTSCASESNNLAIIGVVQKYPYRGKHILTTKLEHSSITESLNYLKRMDYEIEYIPVLENGLIDLDAFKGLLRKDTIMVSIHQVNSEIGICQNLEEIKQILFDYPTTFLHVDGTQAVGKIPINLNSIDLYTCSAHKFYGLKGIACLIKKEKVLLEPMIHGGKSQTIYRSGTPSVALIVSFAKALRLAFDSIQLRNKIVSDNNRLLLDGLNNLNIVVNSCDTAIPHIINFSVPGIKPETLIHALEQKDIFVSTKTACSSNTSISTGLQALGKSDDISTSSIRVSISHLTKKEDIEYFLKELECTIKSLKF